MFINNYLDSFKIINLTLQPGTKYQRELRVQYTF